MKKGFTILLFGIILCLCGCSTAKSNESSINELSDTESIDPDIAFFSLAADTSKSEKSVSAAETDVTEEIKPVKKKEPISIDDCFIKIDDLCTDSGMEKPEYYIVHNGNRLKESRDYSIEFIPDENPELMTACITMKGDYEGSIKKQFRLYTNKLEPRIIKSKVNSISFGWDSIDGADGYYIQYSDNQSMESPKIISVGHDEECSCSIDGLEMNSDIYVRIISFGKNCKNQYGQVKKLSTVKTEVRDGVTYIDGIIIVNKSFPLPEYYGYGEVPEALEAFRRMSADAAADGISLYIASGYRSYYVQMRTYNYFVSNRGQKEADRVSARPGYSEHQTGLAFDVNSTSLLFRYTPQADWLDRNCSKYGFIIRYPENKESITGYIYEPWHIRYIGDRAAEITESGLTLEEYFGIDSIYSD